MQEQLWKKLNLENINSQAPYKVVQMEGPIIDEDGTICAFEVTMYRDGNNNEELIKEIPFYSAICSYGVVDQVGLSLIKKK